MIDEIMKGVSLATIYKKIFFSGAMEDRYLRTKRA